MAMKTGENAALHFQQGGAGNNSEEAINEWQQLTQVTEESISKKKNERKSRAKCKRTVSEQVNKRLCQCLHAMMHMMNECWMSNKQSLVYQKVDERSAKLWKNNN
jgi:hypothetical protein